MLYEEVRPDQSEKKRATFEVTNPATGEKLADIPIFDAEDVAAAVARARKAQKDWVALPIETRIKYMYTLRRVLLENKEKMIQTVVAENGKPRSEVLVELTYISDIVGYYGRNGKKFLADRKASLHLWKNKKGYITYHPHGVLGCITPWNFPLILAFGDAIPALIAGNTVVVKPSEVTPMSALLMKEFCDQAGLPRDVLQIATGLADTGAALIDEVDIVSFTGSTTVGRKVMERAAKTLTPVLLELGGKDPMVVLRDADLERAVRGAVYGGLVNAGQMCISVEMVYVEEPIYDRFVQRVVEEVGKLRVGQETSGGAVIDIGPITLPRQLEIVERQVEDARAKGAKILTGGRRRSDLRGMFYEPTVMTDVTEDMLVMTEETFGPLLPIIKVKDAEEAITLANRSQFGLSGSVWSKDKARGIQIARKLEMGAGCVNDIGINYLTPELPLGGIKQSGIGHRHGGADGIRLFCRSQGLLVDRFGLKREPFWYPYNRNFEKLFSKGLDILFKR